MKIEGRQQLYIPGHEDWGAATALYPIDIQ